MQLLDMCVRMYVCICVGMCVCVYVCVHIYGERVAYTRMELELVLTRGVLNMM